MTETELSERIADLTQNDEAAEKKEKQACHRIDDVFSEIKVLQVELLPASSYFPKNISVSPSKSRINLVIWFH